MTKISSKNLRQFTLTRWEDKWMDFLYKDFDFLIPNKCFQGVVFKIEKTFKSKNPVSDST